jgi:hypothetical protein
VKSGNNFLDIEMPKPGTQKSRIPFEKEDVGTLFLGPLMFTKPPVFHHSEPYHATLPSAPPLFF